MYLHDPSHQDSVWVERATVCPYGHEVSLRSRQDLSASLNIPCHGQTVACRGWSLISQLLPFWSTCFSRHWPWPVFSIPPLISALLLLAFIVCGPSNWPQGWAFHPLASGGNLTPSLQIFWLWTQLLSCLPLGMSVTSRSQWGALPLSLCQCWSPEGAGDRRPSSSAAVWTSAGCLYITRPVAALRGPRMDVLLLPLFPPLLPLAHHPFPAPPCVLSWF